MQVLSPSLVALRRKAGLTQEELARLAGLRRETISHLESGGTPSLRSAIAIARALDVDLGNFDDLFASDTREGDQGGERITDLDAGRRAPIVDGQCAAQSIRSRRELLAFSQDDLAEAAGVSLATLSNLERGRIPRRSRALGDVLRALGEFEAEVVTA